MVMCTYFQFSESRLEKEAKMEILIKIISMISILGYYLVIFIQHFHYLGKGMMGKSTLQHQLPDRCH